MSALGLLRCLLWPLAKDRADVQLDLHKSNLKAALAHAYISEDLAGSLELARGGAASGMRVRV